MKLTQTLFNGPSCVFGLNLTHTGILSIMDFKYFLNTMIIYFLFFTLLISLIFLEIFETITLTVLIVQFLTKLAIYFHKSNYENKGSPCYQS